MAGVGCVLLAYFLLQSGRVPATAPAYSWLNIAGSCAILVSLTHAFNLASFVIQVAWIAISAWGLWRARAHRRLQRDLSPERDR
jgi:hypothetical protein